MRQKPGVYADSFWGDLANALTLRPVYRPPVAVEAPQETQTVTFQSQAESATAPAQQSAQEQVLNIDPTSLGGEGFTIAPVYRYVGDVTEQASRGTAAAASTENPAGTSEVYGREQAAEVMEEDMQPAPHSPVVIERVVDDAEESREEQKHPSSAKPTPSSDDPAPSAVKASGSGNAYFQPKLMAETWNAKIDDRVEIQVVGEKPIHLPAFKRGKGRKLPPSSGTAEYIVVNGIHIPRPTWEHLNEQGALLSPGTQPPLAEYEGASAANDESLFHRLMKPKIKATELKRMGFTAHEAALIEGLYRGKSIYSIASGLHMNPTAALHTIKQLLAKFGVTKTDALLEIIRDLHRDTRWSVLATAQLRMALKDKPAVVTMPVHPITYVGPNIPQNHPDHPANDEGNRLRRAKEQGKRSPAHSTETSSPRNPPPL